MTKFQKYDNVLKEFRKYFDHQDLSAQINSKVDVNMLIAMELKKANKDDIEGLKNLVASLNDRVKHLSNL